MDASPSPYPTALNKFHGRDIISSMLKKRWWTYYHPEGKPSSRKTSCHCRLLEHLPTVESDWNKVKRQIIQFPHLRHSLAVAKDTLGRNVKIGEVSKLDRWLGGLLPRSFCEFLTSKSLQRCILPPNGGNLFIDRITAVTHCNGRCAFVIPFLYAREYDYEWALLLDDDGDEAVVVSSEAFILRHRQHYVARFDGSPSVGEQKPIDLDSARGVWLCADSFPEFVMRVAIESMLQASQLPESGIDQMPKQVRDYKLGMGKRT